MILCTCNRDVLISSNMHNFYLKIAMPKTEKGKTLTERHTKTNIWTDRPTDKNLHRQTGTNADMDDKRTHIDQLLDR